MACGKTLSEAEEGLGIRGREGFLGGEVEGGDGGREAV